jgi:hypothetical protein
LGLSFPNNTGLRGDVGLSRIGEDFNPALGFVRRRGIEQSSFEVGQTWRPRDRAIRQISTGLNANRIDYLDEHPVFGTVQSHGVGIQLLNLELNSQDGMGLNVNRSKEGLRDRFTVSQGVTIPAGVYSFETVNMQFRSGDQRAFGGGFGINEGDFYDGERSGFSTFVGWRSPHFRANLNYQYNEVSFPGKGTQPIDPLDASLGLRCPTNPDCEFKTRVVRLQLETIFSSRLSWINLIQYDNVSGTVGINSRLHWIPQAGREGFLVINHNLREDPLLRPDDDYHTSLAEVTLKYSYTFRF